MGREVEKPTPYYRPKWQMNGKSSQNEPRRLHSAKQTSIDAWGEFQVHTIQLVPSVGAILSDVASQGWKSAIRKSRLANAGQSGHCV